MLSQLLFNPASLSLALPRHPAIFQPIPAGWDRKGATLVNLAKADAATVRLALAAAWRNTVPQAPRHPIGHRNELNAPPR